MTEQAVRPDELTERLAKIPCERHEASSPDKQPGRKKVTCGFYKVLLTKARNSLCIVWRDGGALMRPFASAEH